MIDVVMFLLCFFLLTWNLSRYEQDIAVKVPTARHGEAPKNLPGEIILNLKQDGSVELERSTVTIPRVAGQARADLAGLPGPAGDPARRGGGAVQVRRQGARHLPRGEADQYLSSP